MTINSKVKSDFNKTTNMMAS